MKGDLPCLVATLECAKQLQEMAVTNNITVKNITTSIEEINNKIAEAKTANSNAVNISVFRPLVQAYLKIDTIQDPVQPGQTQAPPPRQRGFLQRIVGIFTNSTNVINEVLSLIGVPLLDKITGTNAEAQRNALTISDLQVKVATLEKGKSEIAEKIRDTVQLQILEFDTSAREFQLSQEIVKREVSRIKIIEVGYRFGEGNSEGYLSQLSALDAKKAQTLRAWTSMRAKLERIKLLCLPQE